MEEKRKLIEQIKEDCEKMAKLAYDLEGCDDCKTCESLHTCFTGIRCSIGDIGKTLKYIFTNLIELDDTIIDLTETLKKHNIVPEKREKQKQSDIYI
jgi:hypothetical protein